tara:strand:- start:476 stop:607 length:132 start_codon:yes stop_codon:yes gene_type:complete
MNNDPEDNEELELEEQWLEYIESDSYSEHKDHWYWEPTESLDS